ncbi:AAA family ATPase [Spirillospora sp. NPDC127506]
MYAEFSEPRTVARVIHLSENGSTAYFEMRNGQTLSSDNIGEARLVVGDVVLIDLERGSLDKAPDDIWPKEPWLGVVKFVGEQRVVVDVGGQLKFYPKPPELNLREGYTVEGFDHPDHIIGIISEKPIKLLDISLSDDLSPDRFKISSPSRTRFEDFGGYPEIVERAKELINLPLEYHRAFEKIGAKPIKGVLFTGPPGTGKTMLAQIIADNADAVFYLINGPEIVSKWLGESEELIRNIFEDAALQERAVIFFDEIDSIGSRRTDDAHEASRRLVNQLLTSLDSFRSDANVVVVAATNRLESIDPALRRPGRFDWEIEFPLPSRQDREAILRVSARSLNIEEDLPHALVAERTDGWTPADLAAIWREAAPLAIRDDRECLLAEDYLGGFERVLERKLRERAASAKVQQEREKA